MATVQENKANAAAKARAAAQAKKAEAKAKAEEPVVEVIEEAKEPTEEDIVKAQVQAKEADREAEAKAKVVEAKPVGVVAPVVAQAKTKPEAIRLLGGKWIAKLKGKILMRGNKDKVDHFIAQF